MGVVMRAADQAGDESVMRPLIGAEDLCSVYFALSVQPNEARTNGAAGLRERTHGMLATGVEDRSDDLAIPGATAQYAADSVHYVLFRRCRSSLQKRGGSHQHSRGANAALRGAMPKKSSLEPRGMMRMPVEPFDRHDVSAFHLSNCCQAGAYWLAIEKDCTCPAIAGVTSHLGAGMTEPLAENSAESSRRRYTHFRALIVQAEPDRV